MRNISFSKHCSNGLVFLRHICQIPPNNCTTVKQVHLNETTYCGIFRLPKNHKNWCLAFVFLHFVVAFSVLLMIFCASFVLLLGASCSMLQFLLPIFLPQNTRLRFEHSGFMFSCFALAQNTNKLRKAKNNIPRTDFTIWFRLECSKKTLFIFCRLLGSSWYF